MALSKVTRTDDAIIVERKASNARAFQNYLVDRITLTAYYKETLERDAQLIRSDKLQNSSQLVSREQSLLEASRRAQSEIIYFTTLQKKIEDSRSRLFGDSA